MLWCTLRLEEGARRTAAVFLTVTVILYVPTAAQRKSTAPVPYTFIYTPIHPRDYLYDRRNPEPVPDYNTSPILAPRNMTFVPYSPGVAYIYNNVSPPLLDLISPRPKQRLAQQDSLDVSQFHLKVTAWHILLVFLASPIAFVLFFLAIPPLLLTAWLVTRNRQVSPKRMVRPFDYKCDPHIRCCLSMLLLTLLTLYGFGVAGAYMTQHQMVNGLRDVGLIICNITRTASKALQNSTVFTWRRSHPNSEVPPIQEKENESFIRIFYYGNYKILRESSVTSLNSIVQQLEGVRQDLRDVKQLDSSLSFLAQDLNSNLRKIKQKLEQTLSRCSSPACSQLQREYPVDSLNHDIQYTRIPDVSNLLTNVTAVMDSRIKEELADSQRVIEHLRQNIQKKKREFIDFYADTLPELLIDQGRLTYEFLNSMWWWAPGAYEKMESVERYREHYEDIYFPLMKYITFIALLLLPIPMMLVGALAWAILGKHPTPICPEGCRYIGVAARWFYRIMALTIVMSFLCCLVTAIFFLLGFIIQRAICEPLQDPRNSLIFGIVDSYVDIEQSVFLDDKIKNSDFNVSTVFYQCYYEKPQKPPLQIFKIMRMYNLSNIRFYIKKDAAHLRSSLAELTAYEPPVEILSNSAKRKLRMLAETPLRDFVFDGIPAVVSTNIVRQANASLSLRFLAKALEQTADNVTAKDGSSAGTVPRDLRDIAADINELYNNTILPMLSYWLQLNNTAEKLQPSRRFNLQHTSLKQAILQQLDEVAQTEKAVNEANKALRKRLEDKKWNLERDPNYKRLTYMVLLVFRQVVTEALPRSGFMVAAIHNAYVALCQHTLLPIHGFWICLAFCLWLLLPILVVSLMLARLYSHPFSYPGPEVVAAYKCAKRNKQQARKHQKRDKLGKFCSGECNTVTVPTFVPAKQNLPVEAAKTQ